jgi:hypothetical protein
MMHAVGTIVPRMILLSNETESFQNFADTSELQLDSCLSPLFVLLRYVVRDGVGQQSGLEITGRRLNKAVSSCTGRR